MRNPLMKRLPRELKKEFVKYLVLFLFMAGSIGFASGFLVADNSMMKAYTDSFETYHIEDGKFELEQEADDDLLAALEDADTHIYENDYVEEETEEVDSTLRIFANREQVDLVCLMEGEMPEGDTDIAIDRMYAINNDLSVGDTLTVSGMKLTITGFVALPDYSCLFQNNTDMMFDAVKFGVAVMTKEGFAGFDDASVHHHYAWTYDSAPQDEADEREKSEALLEVLALQAALTGNTVVDYVPQYSNQAIQFTGEDMGSDKVMMEVLLYIVIVILAFLFAVTVNHTIVMESRTIGTLRASGYTRGELLLHYTLLPVLVTLDAAIVGNLLGYTCFKEVCAGMYYASYSLTTYETIWNAEAFLMTTVIPLLIMLVINVWMLARKLKLPVLCFLRTDLSAKKRKRAVPLPKLRFLTRFRLRIILQNAGAYLTIFAGIVFANLLLFFGICMPSMLTDYETEIVEDMLAPYQYILKTQAETEVADAEKMAVCSLRTSTDGDAETITVYGVASDSAYIDADFEIGGVYISEGYAEKMDVSAGDTIRLTERYGEETYSFVVAGTYEYPAALSVFVSIDDYNAAFGYEDGYYNGYFSRQELTDISEADILSVVDEDDLTKLSRQLQVSMGSMMQMVNVFAAVMFVLIIFLLSRLIIERNAGSISLVKIFGFENREINGLYMHATTLVVVVSVLLSLPIEYAIMRVIFYDFIMQELTGWIRFQIAPVVYVKIFVTGIVCYLLVAWLQARRIRRVPMNEALKSVE